jgi:hypothetical protein
MWLPCFRASLILCFRLQNCRLAVVAELPFALSLPYFRPRKGLRMLAEVPTLHGLHHQMTLKLFLREKARLESRLVIRMWFLSQDKKLRIVGSALSG